MASDEQPAVSIISSADAVLWEMKEILPELNRRTCEFPILQILRERGVAHQDEIDAEVARMFGQNGVAPLVKAKVHQEVNFALSRLFALHLLSRYGDGLASITDEGRTITPDRLDLDNIPQPT